MRSAATVAVRCPSRSSALAHGTGEKLASEPRREGLPAMLIVILYIAHTLALGGWFGAQIYSVLIVQRHPAQDEDPEYYEDFTTRMAHGTRYTLLAVIGVMLPTWVLLVILRAVDDVELGAAWLWLVAIKSAAILATIGLFAFLSWHVWPQRIFALRHELPAVRRRFFGLSLGILAAAGVALAVGIVEQSMGSFLSSGM